MDLANRIRSQRDEGRTADEIVAALVTDGMSEPNARRIVTRVLASPPPPPGPAASKPDDAHANDWSVRWLLLSGAFMFSLGCSFLWVVHVVGKPNPKAKLVYGAILGGLGAMYKGLRRWDPAHSRFPTPLFLVALLTPAIGMYALYEWKRPATAEERLAAAEREEQRERDAQQRLAAEKAKRDERELQRRIAEHERKGAQITDAMQKMMNPNAGVRCEGARFFGANNIRDESGELQRLLEGDRDMNVRRCAVDSLIATGDSAVALRIVERLAKFDDSRPVATYALQKMQQDPDSAVRARASAAMDRIK